MTRVGTYKNKDKRRKYLREYQRNYMKNYRIKLRSLGIKLKWSNNIYHKEIRLSALDILGGRKCTNCGCNIEKILEINHKNGGGSKERKLKNTEKFYRDIINRKVDINLYNVLCKVCNIQHYVEVLLGYKGHTIIWNKPM